MGLDLNMDFTSFLEKIKSKTSTVAINISARSEIEVLEFDKNGLITNYFNAPIQYNQATKEFENVNEIQSVLKTAFSQMNLSLSSRVYVAIPTFVIENEKLPNVDDAEAIKTILLSSAEKNYFFKKYDPAISFYKIPNSEVDDSIAVTYTALRDSEFEKIKSVFDVIGVKAVAIDSSYSAMINGIIATQKVDLNLLDSNAPWKILYITSNSYMLFSMNGRHLANVYEEPLAVKSFTEQEVYQAIINSVDLVLDKNSMEQLVIVSQSDQVSAEYLYSIMELDCAKTYIEDNKYRKQFVEYGLNITQSNKSKISLEAVGICSWPFNTDGFKFNFIDGPVAVDMSADSIFIPIGGKEIEITPEKMRIASYVIAAIVAVILALVYTIFSVLGNAKALENEELVTQVQQLEKQLNVKKEDTGISEEEFLQKSYTNNTNFKLSYSSLAQEIPEMLWVEEIQMADDSNAYIAGRSYRMDDILNYFDSLNKLGKFSNLQISMLKISNTAISDLLLNENSDMVEETTYEFAFGNRFFVDPRVAVEVPQTTEAPKTDAPPPPTTEAAAPSTQPVAPPPTTTPSPTNAPAEEKK